MEVPIPKAAEQLENEEKVPEDEAQLAEKCLQIKQFEKLVDILLEGDGSPKQPETVPEVANPESSCIGEIAKDDEHKVNIESDGDGESEEEEGELRDDVVEAEENDDGNDGEFGENDDDEEEEAVEDGKFRDQKTEVVGGPVNTPVSEDEEDDEESVAGEESDVEEGSDDDDSDEQKSATSTPSVSRHTSSVRSVSTNQKVPDFPLDESYEDDGNSEIVLALVRDANEDSE
jgi:hypothetical protein